jgi:hypothetical protein
MPFFKSYFFFANSAYAAMTTMNAIKQAHFVSFPESFLESLPEWDWNDENFAFSLWSLNVNGFPLKSALL